MLQKQCFNCMCTETGKNYMNQESLYELMYEAIGVSLELCPPLWQMLCWQCEALLRKYVRFRRRLCNKYRMLQEMILQGLTVPSVGQSVFTQSRITILSIEEDFHQKCAKNPQQTDKTLILNEKVGDVNIKYDHINTVKVEDENQNDSERKDLPFECLRKLSSSSDLESKEQLGKEIKGKLKFGTRSGSVEDGSRVTPKTNKAIEVRKESSARIKAHRSPKRNIMELDPSKIRTIHLSKEEQLNAHQKRASRESYLQFPYKCELCYKGYNYAQKLANHMATHQKDGREFSCDICQMRFASVNTCRGHVVRCHEVRFQCIQCDFCTHDKRFALEHYSHTHEHVPVNTNNYSCQYCGKVFRARKNYLSHERAHRTGRKFQCDLCVKTYTIKQSLIAHVMTHTATKQYGCPKCSRRFETPSAAKHHERYHAASYDYYCAECNVSFKAKSALNLHLQTTARHVDVNSFKFKCDQCDKRLQSELLLKRHMEATHLRVKTFFCDTCGLGFHSKYGQRMHVRRQHEGYKPPLRYICHACGKAFPGSGNLKNHIRTHTGERPYSCEQCGATFKQQSAMRLHVKLVHLKIKRVINRKKKCADTA